MRTWVSAFGDSSTDSYMYLSFLTWFFYPLIHVLTPSCPNFSCRSVYLMDISTSVILIVCQITCFFRPIIYKLWRLFVVNSDCPSFKGMLENKWDTVCQSSIPPGYPVIPQYQWVFMRGAMYQPISHYQTVYLTLKATHPSHVRRSA